MMPRAWLKPSDIAARIREEIKYWCIARVDVDGEPIPAPACFQLDLTDTEIQKGLLGAIKKGFASTGYVREFALLRVVERIYLAVKSGRWLNGEPVSLDGVAAAFNWAYDEVNLDTLDEEGNEK